MKNTGLRGKTLKKYRKVKDWETCSKLCSQHPQCEYFTYMGGSRHRCYLKNDDSPSTYQKSEFVSGAKGCETSVKKGKCDNISFFNMCTIYTQ